MKTTISSSYKSLGLQGQFLLEYLKMYQNVPAGNSETWQMWSASTKIYTSNCRCCSCLLFCTSFKICIILDLFSSCWKFSIHENSIKLAALDFNWFVDGRRSKFVADIFYIELQTRLCEHKLVIDLDNSPLLIKIIVWKTTKPDTTLAIFTNLDSSRKRGSLVLWVFIAAVLVFRFFFLATYGCLPNYNY